MPIRPPEFDDLIEKLKPTLVNRPAIIIAITGQLGHGKTTFGRFLAWYFNASLIETDFYLIPFEGINIDTSKISPLIDKRLNNAQPIIVEGYGILEALSNLRRSPNIIIHVQQEEDIPLSPFHDPKEWGFEQVPRYILRTTH
ncbi:hypothetical protein ACO0LD_23310 [Undibacterium sp. Ji83W]|uniref:hypothetical protein n=1 Tax=Undibacterium sp. Ji83W TaxID=3413043 RepID=UPI003BEFE004